MLCASVSVKKKKEKLRLSVASAVCVCVCVSVRQYIRGCEDNCTKVEVGPSGASVLSEVSAI